MGYNYFVGADGNKSSSRLTAFIMIINAIVMVYLFIVIGVFRPLVDLMKIATAVGVLFGSVAGTAMTFLFFQKKEEGKQVKDDLEAKIELNNPTHTSDK